MLNNLRTIIAINYDVIGIYLVILVHSFLLKININCLYFVMETRFQIKEYRNKGILSKLHIFCNCFTKVFP